jgi:plasmid stability protein
MGKWRGEDGLVLPKMAVLAFDIHATIRDTALQKDADKGTPSYPTMTQLEVKDLPESTLAPLRKRAQRHRRSLNGEILSIFDWVIVHGGNEGKTASADPVVLRQKREMEKLIGSWDDSRAAGEIIADIKAAQTAGCKVS